MTEINLLYEHVTRLTQAVREMTQKIDEVDARTQLHPRAAGESRLTAQGIPPTPTGLALVGSTVKGAQIQWQTPAVRGLRYFEVQVADDPSFITNAQTFVTRDTTFSISTKDATTRYVRVRAVGSGGASPFTHRLNVSTGLVETDDIAPGAAFLLEQMILSDSDPVNPFYTIDSESTDPAKRTWTSDPLIVSVPDAQTIVSPLVSIQGTIFFQYSSGQNRMTVTLDRENADTGEKAEPDTALIDFHSTINAPSKFVVPAFATFHAPGPGTFRYTLTIAVEDHTGDANLLQFTPERIVMQFMLNKR